MDNFNKCLLMENAYNIRDLGGYIGSNGKTTKFHSFLRGGDISSLNDNDIKILLDYKVKSIIDLRSQNEVSGNSDSLLKVPGIKYINVPLITEEIYNSLYTINMESEDYLPNLYFMVLKFKKDAIRQIFEFMANELSGCTLIHCTIGKDRTGIIAALLLGLCGVRDLDIISNYESSYDNLKESAVFNELCKNNIMDVMYSKAIYMEKFLQMVNYEYENIKKYLLSIGLTDEILNKVSNRL